VPSNEQRRQAAKRKLERQLARRAERARKRRVWGVGITVGIVVLAVVGVFVVTNLGDDPENAANDKAGCDYQDSPQDQVPEDKKVGLPPNPDPTPATGTVDVTMKTSQGDIPLVLDRAKAPCTVQSMAHLVEKKFFDGISCHRLTNSANLKVLQCGDPSGTGGGGPGYTVPDENPKDLASAGEPDPQTGQSPVTYPRGTLAMANTGQPHSGGSQFFMVFGDSVLPPNYSVFGTIGEAGLATLDKVAAGGITPGQDPQTGAPTPEDGQPVLAVKITSATKS
jgi:peptidyl-prolyl cis-trans isomerase B (cyclophilin B)